MGVESEIKFEVSSRDIQKLAASRILLRSNGELPQQQYLVSTYFDTRKSLLRRNGVSLRVRKAGKKHTQTIKTLNEDVAFGRGEWEHKLRNDEPDLRAARGTALQPLISRKLKHDLRPIFATHVQRTLLPLHGNSRIEMALDEGQLRAGQKSAPLSEVELELKSGKLADLFKAARVVAELVPAKLALKSKSELGYDLISEQRPRAVHASRIFLQNDANVAAAFQVIGRSVLRHLAANEPTVLAGDPEGVHQMRVGVRRFRAAIAVFSEFLSDEQTKRIKRELKWLAGKLGPVRDLDAFLHGKIQRLGDAQPPIAGLTELKGEMIYRRDLAAESAMAAVASARYRLLIFSVLEWIEDGKWLKRSRSQLDKTIKQFAARLFEQRTRKVRKKTRKVGAADVDQRHELRIAVKKLRYAVYFFESLFSQDKRSKPLSRYKENLRNLQELLGELNDIAIRQKILPKLAAASEGPKPLLVGFAAGVIAGREQSEVGSVLHQATTAARKLRRAKKFWI